MAQQRMLHGQTHYGTVSRFVEEIPQELLHLLTPVLRARFPVSDVVLQRGETVKTEQSVPPADYDGFAVGQNVRHAKFGTGVVIDGAHKGSSARLTVNFGKQGIKVLDTAFAKLEAV